MQFPIHPTSNTIQVLTKYMRMYLHLCRFLIILQNIIIFSYSPLDSIVFSFISLDRFPYIFELQPNSHFLLIHTPYYKVMFHMMPLISVICLIRQFLILKSRVPSPVMSKGSILFFPIFLTSHIFEP